MIRGRALRGGALRRPLVLLSALVLAFVASPATGGGPPSPWPSSDEVAHFGFAVWPEDTVQEAQQACADHADDQPWRLSPTETALQFARVKLDHEEPEVAEEQTEIGPDEARVWLMAPEVSLSNIFELRRHDVCWYITRGDEREDSVGASVVFARKNGDKRVYLENSHDSSLGELGFGEHARQWGPAGNETRRSWALPQTADREGHVLVVDWDSKGDLQGGEGVYARPLPPPPRIGEGEKVFPVRERFSWDELPKEDRKRSCRLSSTTEPRPRRVLNYMLEWVFSRAMPSGPYPDVFRTGPHGWIGDRVRVDRMGRGKWRVEIDDVRYGVVVIKGAEECWALKKWVPLDKKRPLEEAFFAESSATIDFRWGRAKNSSVSVGYGSELNFAGLRDYVASRVAFYRYNYEDWDPGVPVAGRVMVIQTRQGRYVNAYSRLLPPQPPAAP